MKNLKRISHEEFQNLQIGDTIFVKCGDKIYESKIITPPFYNIDADEPDWEIETTNGFCDEYSLYKLKGTYYRRHF